MDQNDNSGTESSVWTPTGQFDNILMFSEISEPEHITPDKVIKPFDNPFEEAELSEQLSSISNADAASEEPGSPRQSPTTSTRKAIVSRIRDRQGPDKAETQEVFSINQNMQVSSEIDLMLKVMNQEPLKVPSLKIDKTKKAQHSRAKSARELNPKKAAESSAEAAKLTKKVGTFLAELDKATAIIQGLEGEAGITAEELKSHDSLSSASSGLPPQGRKQNSSVPRAQSSRHVMHIPKKVSYANVKSKVDTGSANMSRRDSFASNDSGTYSDHIPKIFSGNSTPNLHTAPVKRAVSVQKSNPGPQGRSKPETTSARTTKTAVTSAENARKRPAVKEQNADKRPAAKEQNENKQSNDDSSISPWKRPSFSSIGTEQSDVFQEIPRRTSISSTSSNKSSIDLNQNSQNTSSSRKTVPTAPNLATSARTRSQTAAKTVTKSTDSTPSAWARLPTSPIKRTPPIKRASTETQGTAYSPRKRSPEKRRASTDASAGDDRYLKLEADYRLLEIKLKQTEEASEIKLDRLQLETDYYKSLIEKEHAMFEMERQQWKGSIDGQQLIAQLRKEIAIKGKIELRNTTEIARLKQELHSLKN